MPLRRSFLLRDARLTRCAGLLGLVFACFTVVGGVLQEKGGFPPFSWPDMLYALLWLLLLTLLYGAALGLLYKGADALARRRHACQKESLFSRVLGNSLFVFVLLLLCWLPVWLAFWPGTFVYDSGTQFYTYIDGAHTTHHPLLHTLLLGYCVTLGIDLTAEGSAAVGLAIYCAVQMVLLAAMLAYACHWLRRRRAPLFMRVLVTLLFAIFPFYPVWSFCAQKDVLFAGLALLFVLGLVDLWRDGFSLLRSPFRVIKFVLIAALMMLFRNNGVYALCLLLPFAVLWAKGARPRVTALLAGCVAVYLLANTALIHATEAESGSKVEILPIPLQQIARTLRDHPDALDAAGQELIDELYGTDPSQYYVPELADPVKWAIDYDALEENIPRLLSLWLRLGVAHPISYAEAFLVQNLPYYLPFSEMQYRLDLGVIQIDLFPIEEYSYFPELRELYMNYDQTLTFLGVPGVRLLSDTAFSVWLALAGAGLAMYRRQKRWLPAFGFLLAVWATCLLGPVALIRYMLSFFYAVPVLLAAMLAPDGEDVGDARGRGGRWGAAPNPA